MKVSVLLVLLSFPLLVNAQIDYDNPPWELPYDSLSFGTQTEMNIFSAKEAHIADSVMTALYNSVVNYMETELKIASSDTTYGDGYWDIYLNQLKNQIAFIKESQKNFEIYKISVLNFVSESYSGGSICPLMVNTYALKLIVERIKLLEEIRQELQL